MFFDAIVASNVAFSVFSPFTLVRNQAEKMGKALIDNSPTLTCLRARWELLCRL